MHDRVNVVLRLHLENGAGWHVIQVDTAFDLRPHHVPVDRVTEVRVRKGRLVGVHKGSHRRSYATGGGKKIVVKIQNASMAGLPPTGRATPGFLKRTKDKCPFQRSSMALRKIPTRVRLRTWRDSRAKPNCSTRRLSTLWSFPSFATRSVS